MTTKKYILIYAAFLFMLALCPVLFFVGCYFKETNTLLFYILIILSLFSLTSAIILIISKYKKLISYEVKRIKKKINDLDFTSIETSVTKNEIINRLISNGYKFINAEILYKEVEENCGDGDIILRYCAKLITVENELNLEQCLDGFNKGLTNYNIGYVFIDGNLEENLHLLKEYIKDTIVDVEVHRYKYKNFFVPIIISENKIFYLKGGSFISEYKTALKAGTQIFSSDFKGAETP